MIPGRVPKLQHPKKNLQAKENRAMGTHGTFPQPPGRSYSTYAPSCHSCSWNSVVVQVTWKHKNVGSLVTKQRSKHQKKGQGENLPPRFLCVFPHNKNGQQQKKCSGSKPLFHQQCTKVQGEDWETKNLSLQVAYRLWRGNKQKTPGSTHST